MSEVIQQFAQFVSPAAGKPLIVHSDLLPVTAFHKPAGSRDEVLAWHYNFLEEVLKTEHIWMPQFNYDFGRTRVFDVAADAAQVGPLPEHFRVNRARWRTCVPMFSFGGAHHSSLEWLSHIGTTPVQATIDPFGDNSVFDILARHKGWILFYGAPFSSCTFLHHVERFAGNPLYRYDKSFPGTVRGRTGQSTSVTLICHVRPLDCELDYDWVRIERDLINADLLRTFSAGRLTVARLIDANALRSFWRERIEKDPLYLLDSRSRSWVTGRLQSLKRRFHIDDFETVTA